MVLSLKAWKSRSLPGLPRTDYGAPRAPPHHDDRIAKAAADRSAAAFCFSELSRRGLPRGGFFMAGGQADQWRSECFLTLKNSYVVLSPCCWVKKPRASSRLSLVPSRPCRRGLPFDT